MNGAPSADLADGLSVGGVTPLSTVDWPGELAAVVFCQGCVWNCPYCHNAGLRPFGSGERPWSEVLAWLETRQGLLDAVVFSGGEPLLQRGLAQALRTVRGLGFKTGLHTSGLDPMALSRALPFTDWIGLDLKAPRAAYARVTGHAGAAEALWASLELVRASGVALELRTTWHPDVLSVDEVTALAGELSALKSVDWVLQPFQPQGCADAALAALGRAQVPLRLVAALRAALGKGGRLRVRE